MARVEDVSKYLFRETGSDRYIASMGGLKAKLGQLLRLKRVRVVGTALMATFTFAALLRSRRRSDFNTFNLPLTTNFKQVDWSRFAYTQYVTDADYLCTSLMLFEILHRLGSKADRLMMYPSHMDPDTAGSNTSDSHLLLKAQREYGVKLMPVEIQHRSNVDPTWGDSFTKLLAFNQTQYDRVLSLDSDSTILQPMDELFLIPHAPVAMPRAYWLDNGQFSAQIMLIEPSAEEFQRVMDAIHNNSGTDMEVVNDLYSKDCLVLPHRAYDLLTGEFRSKDHSRYLGNDHEKWDPQNVLKEAKYLHFSDWPVPKPWLPTTNKVIQDNQPNCFLDENGKEDCGNREAWLGFYSEFTQRLKRVCDIEG